MLQILIIYKLTRSTPLPVNCLFNDAFSYQGFFVMSNDGMINEHRDRSWYDLTY